MGMAEGESATLLILFLANAGIAKCVDEIYPLLYPQMIGLCGSLTEKNYVGVTLTGDYGGGRLLRVGDSSEIL